MTDINLSKMLEDLIIKMMQLKEEIIRLKEDISNYVTLIRIKERINQHQVNQIVDLRMENLQLKEDIRLLKEEKDRLLGELQYISDSTRN